MCVIVRILLGLGADSFQRLGLQYIQIQTNSMRTLIIVDPLYQWQSSTFLVVCLTAMVLIPVETSTVSRAAVPLIGRVTTPSCYAKAAKRRERNNDEHPL